MSIPLAKWLDIPSFVDERGTLSCIEKSSGLPFEIKRIYYLYNVKSEEERGYHAHIKLEQLFIPISGSFKIMIDDGSQHVLFEMHSPNKALYVPKMRWRVLSNFTSNAVCLVLASEPYNPQDYIYDYSNFKKLASHTIHKHMKEI